MKTTRSSDGTVIAYEELGSGPPVILVDGAFCRRAFGPMTALAALLSTRFTVFHYDRRGRGESGDTPPYDAQREVEDLAAIVEKAGAAPYVYGISSGAALVIRAMGHGVPAKKLALYEPPFALDGMHHPSPADYREQIAAMLAAGRRDDAVKLFMKVVGVPAFGIFFMRLLPNVWPKLRAVAHTLPYDFAVLGDTQHGGPLPVDLAACLAAIEVPTLAMAGTKSPAWMHHNGKTIATRVAGASFRAIEGQDHNLSAKALAPILFEHFS